MGIRMLQRIPAEKRNPFHLLNLMVSWTFILSSSYARSQSSLSNERSWKCRLLC
ncbi:hypothetical protein ASPCADRAFT_209413 [Aspergillus carbonarius ITEM 5010]|uniref:Uncharacterized protein n=1 Tax=Aspergillus carbonarius (strain ITEM 5010) TaxID=602072 RepID=A0A1R3RG55_ASPC5|nr:hypothetical protein ASPCADRAFT_209413 [Aspergillus carbonarius ITEM 5010]